MIRKKKMKFKLLLLSALLSNGFFIKKVVAADFETICEQADLVAFQDEDDTCLDDVAASVKNIQTQKQEITFKDKVYFGFLALWMFGVLKPYQYCKEKVALIMAKYQ